MDWIRNCLDGDRQVLDREELKVLSANELPKLFKVAYRARKVYTTDPSILLNHLQRFNESIKILTTGQLCTSPRILAAPDGF